MQEKHLVKISLLMTIIGFTFLLIYSQKIDLNEINLQNMEFVSEEIKIIGKIDSLNNQKKATFLTITGQKTQTVDIILFNNEDTILNKGDLIEISGTIEEYEGKNKIIASEVKII